MMTGRQHSKRGTRLIHRIQQLNDGLIRIENWVSVSLLSVLLVSMCAQVIARYCFNSPFTWSEELSRFALIWLTFVAASLVMARRGHITVDLWSPDDSMRSSMRRWIVLETMIDITILVTCTALLLGGIRFVWYVHPVGSPSLGIPKSAWYGAVSVGLALMALHSLLHLVVFHSKRVLNHAESKEISP